MPRGAILTPRNLLAAAEPYRAESSSRVSVPSGLFPSSSRELAVSDPYLAGSPVPDSYLLPPVRTGPWQCETLKESIWAEEAFAKACAEPGVFISSSTVTDTSRICGLSNFSVFMQKQGFRIGDTSYLSGEYLSVDWLSTETLNSAIACTGPVKIVAAFICHASGAHGKLSLMLCDWSVLERMDTPAACTCASVFGYGSTSALAKFLSGKGYKVEILSGKAGGSALAVFIRGVIAVVDRQSMLCSTGEAWVRSPTTVVKRMDY